MPIPKIEDTCARYLAALKPVAPSEQEFVTTQGLVEDFKHKGGIGQGNAHSLTYTLVDRVMTVVWR